MKRILFIITFSILVNLSVRADDASIRALNLISKCGEYVTPSDKLGFLRMFNGDTITFNITAISNLEIFTKEVPDTIWIKKVKKNPQEGKHYRLSYLYKGIPNTTGEYRTPTSAINGKPFGVLSVEVISNSDYATYNKDLLLNLIDLDDLSRVKCRIPYNNNFSFTISSNKINRDIKSIIGEEFYIKTGAEYSNPNYTLSTLSGSTNSILFDARNGRVSIRCDIRFYFGDKDGQDVPFRYEKPRYRGSDSEAPIVSKSEYEDKHFVRTINSHIDFDHIKSEVKLPFDFKYIWGVRKGNTAVISQRIVPDDINRYSWTSDYQRAPEDELMFVGGTLTVKDTKFLKMIFRGKAFFMKADDVKLSREGNEKLDSLENSSKEIQEIFWNKTLLLNQRLYDKRVEDALEELESYSKYGLAINSCGVYDESEYTDGTGFRITFLNPTKQIIKYITITFQGYNPVDDPYGRQITKRCVGPINPFETATYKFEYVWFSDVVEYAKIRSITVTFKNGAVKTIKNPKAIMLSEKVWDIIFDSNPVEDFD